MTTHNTGHHNQPWGGAHNQHTPDKKQKNNRRTAPERGAVGGNTTRHPTMGQKTTQRRPTQHTPTQGKIARQDPAQQCNPPTAPKGNNRPQAPQNKTRGQSTEEGHQRQHGEEKGRQHGATGRPQNDRQQHRENRHNQGAPNDTAQAQTGPRRGTTPTATHTNTPHSPGDVNHPSTAHTAQHGREKKGSRRKMKQTNKKHRKGTQKRTRRGGGESKRGGGDKTPRPKAPRA